MVSTYDEANQVLVYTSCVNMVAKAHLFTAVFSQLTIFTADCLGHTVQIAGIETIWELHTLTVMNSCEKKAFFFFAETRVQTVETQLEDQTKHTPGSESQATSSARCSNSSSPPPSEASQKPPFGCGCGSCTLFSFIERGCPTPFSSKNTFPYLKLSGLTDEQQENLKERLRFETREIMMRFQELVSATIKSLIRQNVSVDELVPHVMTLGAFDPVVKEPQVPLFQDCLKELKAAVTISKVFMVLNDYFSFFNYDIIEHIIKVLGTIEDKAELQKYKDKFDQYSRRRIFECGPHFGPEKEKDHPDIFVKLDSRYDNYTVAEIKGFCRKLSEILHLSSKGVLRLCRVEKGCFQLTFQVPSFVQHETFPLSNKQERTLKAEGVIKLACGEYQLADSPEEPQHKIGASGKCVHVAIPQSKLDFISHSQLMKWRLLNQYRRKCKLLLTQYLMERNLILTLLPLVSHVIVAISPYAVHASNCVKGPVHRYTQTCLA